MSNLPAAISALLTVGVCFFFGLWSEVFTHDVLRNVGFDFPLELIPLGVVYIERLKDAPAGESETPAPPPQSNAR